MDRESEGATTPACSETHGEDTLEIELSESQQLALQQAAETAERKAAPPIESATGGSEAAGESLIYRRTARVDLICTVTFAAVVLSITAGVVWHATVRHTRSPATIVPTPVQVMAAAPAEPQGAPVRVRNPFDATELFEFPPGTSEGEAHDAAAALLLRRAGERLAQGIVPERTALRRLPRRAPPEPHEIFVTRLSASTNTPH